MNIKKLLRQPLLYLLPLLVVAFLSLINTNIATKISEVQLTRNNITQNIKLPYLDDMEHNEVFSVSFDLMIENENLKLNLIPDDCIQELLVNGERFPLDSIQGLCDGTAGAIFKLSKYVQKGVNHFDVRIINSGGGPAGIDVELHNKYGNFSLTHYVSILLLFLCFAFISRQSLFKLLLLFVATVLLYFVAGLRYEVIPDQSIIFLVLIFISTSSIFLFNKRVNCLAYAFILTALACLMFVRGALLYFRSMDYNGCLIHWVARMRELSVTGTMVESIGDYNMPYMYVLMLISRFNISDLYLIKIVSIIFDIVLAYYVMKVVSLKFDNINVRIAAFITTLCIPTVILNGAFWAQCDVIYTALALAFLYYGMVDKSIRAYVFLGLAFSIKLQTIFIAPVLIVFLFAKKINIKHIWVLPVTFFATLVPALLAGRPFMETITIYSGQMDAYPFMVLDAPNIYTLLGDVKFENFNFAAIMFAGIATIYLLYFLYMNREKITTHSDYVSIAFAFVLIIPMLLPRMHERYLFMADVLSVVLVFFNKKRWYFAPMIILGSYVTYIKCLQIQDFLIPLKYISIVMIFVTLIVIKDLIERFRNRS